MVRRIRRELGHDSPLGTTSLVKAALATVGQAGLLINAT